jgi:hypothetical protein
LLLVKHIQSLLVAVEAEQQTIPHQTEPLEATHNLHQLFLLEVVKAVLLLRLMRRVQAEALEGDRIWLAQPRMELLVQETRPLGRQVKVITVELLLLVILLISQEVGVVALVVLVLM